MAAERVNSSTVRNTDEHPVYCIQYRRPRTSPSNHFVARLWQHPPYFHDGIAATLDDGVTPYNNFRRLRLSVALQRDLVQLLKPLVPRLVAKISWIKITFAGEPLHGD